MLSGAIFLLTCTYAAALDIPPLQGRVNDLAGMLTADQARQLEEQLRQFEEETTHQIVVLTIPSLQGDALEDFSIRVAESWKIGHNGIESGQWQVCLQYTSRGVRGVGHGMFARGDNTTFRHGTLLLGDMAEGQVASAAAAEASAALREVGDAKP